MGSRKTSPVFTSHAAGHPLEAPTPILYPRSTIHFSKLFYSVFNYGYAPRNEANHPLEAFGEIENREDWDLFTVHFKWREKGAHTPALEAAITKFVKVLSEGEGLKCYISTTDDGASIAFTHPDHALRTLHYLISHTKKISLKTMTTFTRNSFEEADDCGPVRMSFIEDLYKTHAQQDLRDIRAQNLDTLPMKPYVSQEDAATQFYLTARKLQSGFLIVDFEKLANDVALDCGRTPPHPYAAVH